MTTHRLINTPEGFVDPESLSAHQLPTSHTPPQETLHTRVNTGPIRVTMNAGQVSEESVGVSRHVVGRDDGPATSIAQSFRKMGPQASVELEPGNPMSRTDVRSAERAGLIRFDTSTGQWVDVERTPAAAREPVQTPNEVQEQDPGREYFAPEDDATWAQMIDPLPQPAYDAAVSRAIGLVAHGTGSIESIANVLARDAGIEPSRALELVVDGMEVYRRPVLKALAKEGMDEIRAAEFFQSLKAKPDALHAAVQRLTTGRDVGGFVDLARAYEVANPSPLVKAMEAAFEIARDPVAGELVCRPKGSTGGWHPVKAVLAKGKA